MMTAVSVPASSLSYAQQVTRGLDYVAGIYYRATLRGLATVAAATTNGTGTLYFLPFVCDVTHTFTAIGFTNSASVNTAKFRMGIYNSSGRGPGSVLIDAGELTVADANTSTIRDIAISQSVPVGLSWLAWMSDGNSRSVFAPATVTHSDWVYDIGCAGDTISGGPLPATLSCAQAYGAMPATAGALAFVPATQCPILHLKG